jgi:hypothetical protein
MSYLDFPAVENIIKMLFHLKNFAQITMQLDRFLSMKQILPILIKWFSLEKTE